MSGEQPRILVGASGSQASRRAVETAAGLTGAFDAELVIAHVLPAREYRVTRFATPLVELVGLGARRHQRGWLVARVGHFVEAHTARPVLREALDQPKHAHRPRSPIGATPIASAQRS